MKDAPKARRPQGDIPSRRPQNQDSRLSNPWQNESWENDRSRGGLQEFGRERSPLQQAWTSEGFSTQDEWG